MWILTPEYVRGCYLEGVITNASNGLAVSGASVKLLGPNTSETSNAAGQYKMGQLQDGSFTAQVSKAGFVTKNIPVSLSNGVLTTLNVILYPVGFPVELTEFSVEAEGRDALLHWETASETDNAGFEVQHGAAANQWEVAGFVPARGNHDTPARYDFRVPGLSPGSHLFRLKQLDLDGKTTFSATRTLEIKGKQFHAAFRPTAAGEYSELYFFSESPTPVRVELFNAAGLPAGLQWTFDLEHETTLPVELGQLPAGLYFAVVQTERERVTVPLVKM